MLISDGERDKAEEGGLISAKLMNRLLIDNKTMINESVLIRFFIDYLIIINVITVFFKEYINYARVFVWHGC